MAIDFVTLALAKGYTDGSGAEAIEQTYADNGVLGAKNLLPFPYANTTKTVNGCTFTVNSDESITVSSSGAISAEASFELCYALDLSEKVILTGCPIGGSTGTYGIQIYTTNSTQGSWNDFGNGYTLDLTNDSITRLVIRIRSGMDLTTPITFYPMLRLATDTDDTYQPYAMTNAELTEKVKNTGTYALGMIVAAVTPSNGKQPEFFIPWYNPDLKNASFSFTIRMRGASSWEEITQESAIGVQNVSKNGFLVNANLQTALTSNTTFTFRLDGSIIF